MVAYEGVLEYIRSHTKHEHKVGTPLIGQFLGEIKIVQIVLRLLVGMDSCLDCRNKRSPFGLEHLFVLSDTSTVRPSCVWLRSASCLTN